MPSEKPPDWQLPDGVTTGTWEYLHSEKLAAGYDATLADAPLATVDSDFLQSVLPHSGRVIDLGCGTGRHALALAARGFEVVGVDLSEAMLKIAQERTSADGLVVSFVRATLVELDHLRDRSFDHAICMFSTLGMIHGEANRECFVGHVHRLLRPGGLFVVHVHNYWFNLWNRQARRWLVTDLLRSLLPGQRSGERVMPFHQGVANLYMHLYKRGELRRLLRKSGFDSVTIRPISLRTDGRLRCPWWFGGLRAYGYFAVARK
jgi:SAM-dependent methyltransferase